MIKFKTLKYKHFRKAQELSNLLANKEIKEDEILTFALSLVESWDFKDVDTGEELEIGELDELSQEQFTEVFTEFANILKSNQSVPKVKAEV